jgi:hypothetical protein
MKTAMQELLQILESKILPCDDDNSYVYGMNVAHANLIYNIKNGFLEKEKEQIIEAFEDGQLNVNEDGCLLDENGAEHYYNQTYNQN